MKPWFIVSALLLVLLSLSCVSPLLERAHDPEGFSGGLGVNGVGAVIPGFEPEDITAMLVVAPTATVRYRFGHGVSLSLQGGPVFSLDSMSTIFPESLGGLGACAEVGLKVPLGRFGAVKLNAGAFGEPPWTAGSYLPLVNLTLLHDFSNFVTLSASAGLPMLVGAGITIHAPIGEHVVTHFYAGASAVFSGGAGFGLDIIGKPEPQPDRQIPGRS